MKIPRDVNGVDLVRVLCAHFAYKAIHQAGSHIILKQKDQFITESRFLLTTPYGLER